MESDALRKRQYTRPLYHKNVTPINDLPDRSVKSSIDCLHGKRPLRVFPDTGAGSLGARERYFREEKNGREEEG